MTDETTPKRLRGQKERERLYRAGFLDGLVHAAQEHAEKRDIDAKRDGAVVTGLRRYLAAESSAPKRTRRKKAELVNLVDGSVVRGEA